MTEPTVTEPTVTVELPGGGQAKVRALSAERLQALAVTQALAERSRRAEERALATRLGLTGRLIVAGCVEPAFSLADPARLARLGDADREALAQAILAASHVEDATAWASE